MKRIFLSLLAYVTFVSTFAQTTLQPDQFEPNNSITQATNPNITTNIFEPYTGAPNKRVFQANFHDSTDESDWYIMTFTNLSIPVAQYWPSYDLLGLFGRDYPYMETVEVALSGMSSGADYSISIHNATSSMTSTPSLPVSVSGSQDVRSTVHFRTNNLGSIESLLIGVRRGEGNTVNEGYTITFSFSRYMPDLPTITSISPASGPVGTMITITGTNLGLGPIFFTKKNPSYLYCLHQPLAPVPSSPLTSITQIVPDCAMTGPVWATRAFGGGTSGNTQIFTVTNEITNDKINPFKRDSLPQKPSEPSGSKTNKWVITPVSTMKGVLGRLDINFPADVERNILIYQATDNKFLRSVSRNDKIYTIAPGQYRFTLTNVPVDNVPIQKGHETRLKAGFLNIVSEGDWHLYNDTKETQYTSGNKPKKLPLPVGSYQLKLGTQFYPVVIKDGETVEL